MFYFLLLETNKKGLHETSSKLKTKEKVLNPETHSVSNHDLRVKGVTCCVCPVVHLDLNKGPRTEDP